MAASPTRDRVKPETINTTPLRRPDWIRVRAPSGETYQKLHQLMRVKELHTVCEEAMCPNMGECWGSGTATFLMMGDVCTRSCGFCDIKHGRPGPLRIVVEARPEILNHNVETVPRLFRKVQPQDRYEWAQATLSNAKRIDPEVLTKSGIMLGLGETLDEVVAVMRDLRTWGVEILTLGQYLQPSKRHLPVERFYTLDEFAELRRIGLEELGFRWVESAPLVRSSYHAEAQVRALSTVHRKLWETPAAASAAG